MRIGDRYLFASGAAGAVPRSHAHRYGRGSQFEADSRLAPPRL
jgi:hypothetical protein